jgi:hypothetical protein
MESSKLEMLIDLIFEFRPYSVSIGEGGGARG